MLKGRFNANWNKVKTKEELLELLKGYRGILKKTMLNYLNSLIELEFSVISEYINDSDRKALAELEIYKNVAIYNIYNRAQNLFNKQNGEFIIYGNNDENEGLSVGTKLSDRYIKLFDFDYREIRSNMWKAPIPSGFKTMNIGDISLFQTIESNHDIELLTHGQYPDWLKKRILSDDDKREIEITKHFHDLLLEDFGLTNESFVDKSSRPFGNFGQEKKELKRTLVKRMPNLTLTDNIRYI